MKLLRYEPLIKMGLDKLGVDNQTTIAIEELSELQKEICKFKRGKVNRQHLAEEISHSILMIENLIVYFNLEDEVKEEYNLALQRLVSLID
jgi:hypothetical protein